MSLSRSMWFYSTSFVLSRECYGFKLFQCVWFSHVTPNRSPMRKFESCYLCTYEFMWSPRLTRCLGDSSLWSMKRHPPPDIVSECSSESMFLCMLRLTLWSHCIQTRDMFRLTLWSHCIQTRDMLRLTLWSLPSAKKLLPLKLFFQLILSSNLNFYRN